MHHFLILLHYLKAPYFICKIRIKLQVQLTDKKLHSISPDMANYLNYCTLFFFFQIISKFQEKIRDDHVRIVKTLINLQQ